MSLSMFRKSGKRGFTLVELLIVVAIIGVLATIGVPTFRRMVQKSKKSEAKVNLGGLYTSEAAFNAEYNTYGNNLAGLGFEIEGAGTAAGNASLTYMVGFYDANCADLDGATVHPTQAANNAAFTRLNAAFPGYYVPVAPAVVNKRMGRQHPAASVCFAAAPPPGIAQPNTGATFTAGASGPISPNAGAPFDVWTINNNRVLSNVQDGIQ